MNPTAKMLSPSDLLAIQFLEKAKELQAIRSVAADIRPTGYN
jgi:hypothetical protein